MTVNNSAVKYIEVPLPPWPIVSVPGAAFACAITSFNELALNDSSVSKIHAALTLNQQGTLLVADTGSTNGTFINGRRIAYGEARQIEDRDVVGFGDVEVRFRPREDE